MYLSFNKLKFWQTQWELSMSVRILLLYISLAGTFRNINTKKNLLEQQKETLILLKTKRIFGSRTSRNCGRTYNLFLVSLWALWC